MSSPSRKGGGEYSKLPTMDKKGNTLMFGGGGSDDEVETSSSEPLQRESIEMKDLRPRSTAGRKHISSSNPTPSNSNHTNSNSGPQLTNRHHSLLSMNSNKSSSDKDEKVGPNNKEKEKDSKANIGLKTVNHASSRFYTSNSESNNAFSMSNLYNSNSNHVEEDESIWHKVEKHHTLAGIALQYRCTIADLKRLNNLWTEDELHTRQAVKIPPRKFVDLRELENEPFDEKMTTRNIIHHPHELNDRVKNTYLYMGDESTPPTSSNSATRSPQDFFKEWDKKFEKEKTTQIEREQAKEENGEGEGRVVPILSRRVSQGSLLSRMAKDWRFILLLILAITSIPIFFTLFKIEEEIEETTTTAHPHN